MLRRLVSLRDLVLALGLAVLGEAELFSAERYNGKPVWPGPVWLNAVLIVLLTAPLVWRRSRPLASVAAVCSVGTVASLTLGAPEAATAFVLLIVTTFSGAAYSPRWPAVVACVVVLNAAHAINDPSSEGPADLFWVFGLAGISVLLGRALYAHQHRIGTLERDARMAEEVHARQVAEATAAERSAIAREMHDLVSHAVSVIVIQAQAGERALPADPGIAAGALRDIEASARTAMTELRRLLVLLDDGEPAAMSPAPSLAMVPSLLDQCRATGLDVLACLPPALPALPPSTDAAVYHVVREALTNAMRHAPGSRVALVMSEADEFLDISVTDTGPASPVAVGQLGTGRGLIGMRQRVELAGGQLIAGPHLGGFRVQARIPLLPEAASTRLAVRTP